MPEVDSQRSEEGDEVDDEQPLFPVVGLAILGVGCLVTLQLAGCVWAASLLSTHS